MRADHFGLERRDEDIGRVPGAMHEAGLREQDRGFRDEAEVQRHLVDGQLLSRHHVAHG